MRLAPRAFLFSVRAFLALFFRRGARYSPPIMQFVCVVLLDPRQREGSVNVLAPTSLTVPSILRFPPPSSAPGNSSLPPSLSIPFLPYGFLATDFSIRNSRRTSRSPNASCRYADSSGDLRFLDLLCWATQAHLFLGVGRSRFFAPQFSLDTLLQFAVPRGVL